MKFASVKRRLPFLTFLGFTVWAAGGSVLYGQNARQQADSDSSPILSRVDKSLENADQKGNQDWLELVGERGHLILPDRAKSRANQAEQFYRKYPTHPKAIEARKIEIESILASTDADATELKSRLDSRVHEFRSDKRIPENTRAEVARNYDLRESVGRMRTFQDSSSVFEEVARGLNSEFPDSEIGAEMLLSLASKRGNPRGGQLANELEAARVPAQIKKRAKSLATRLGLVGQNIQDVLPQLSRSAEISSGKLTVVYTWSAANNYSLANARLLKDRNIDRANWIGINLDDGTAIDHAKRICELDGFPGTQYYAGEKMGEALVRKLGADQPGIVMLLDESGNFIDVNVGEDQVRILSSFGL